MRIPQFQGNTLGGYMTASSANGIPTRFRPLTNIVTFPILVVNVGVSQYYPGELAIWSSGRIDIFMQSGGTGNFTTGALSGLQTDVVVSWLMI